MPFQGLEDALYLVAQRSPKKGVDHYGILDVGNNLGYVAAPAPVVVHQSPPAIRADWLSVTGAWRVVWRIPDTAGALDRLRLALARPSYDLLGNNCEHFARYVATGKRESTQLHSAMVIVSLGSLVVLAAKAQAA
jgi:hypothetical protein